MRLAVKATETIEADAKTVLGVEAERVLQVMERLKAVALAERTAALIVLGDALLRAYEEQKRLRNYLDYDDLIMHARGLLSRPGVAPWVLYKLDGGIDHILIDEAQDTSPDQWDVAAALAEEFFAGEGAREAPRTVFVVGDEKQSIYSFQGADPAAFEDMRQHFRARVEAARQTWQPVALLRSFRSAPAILSAVDAIFAQDEARAGVTAGDEPIRHESNRMGQAGLVEVWPTLKDEDAPEPGPWEPPLVQEVAVRPDTRLAERIAGRIKHWLQSGEMLPARGRPVRPGDIMILVRRRNDFFEDMVRTLKQMEIPVAGADRMVLSDQLAVMDLVALGRFVLLPEDDLTLAVVLKGPLFGFDDARLFDLAHGRGKTKLWDRLKERSRDAGDFARAFERLAALLALVDFVSPFEFFAGVLSKDGRKQILGRLGPEANDPLDEFLARALAFERDHVPSLERFLHWLEAGAAEVKRDLEQGNNQVRVMTVHGAKGLEAPIVFLPDTCATPHAREPLLWADDGNGGPFPLWPVRADLEERVSRTARAAERKRRDEEYRRLFYVALTRAEDRLYICGWETRHGRGEGCWYDLAATGLIDSGQQVEVDFGEPEGPVQVLRIEGAQSVPAQERAAKAGERPVVTPLPDWASNAPPAEPVPPKQIKNYSLVEGSTYQRGCFDPCDCPL
ncbi:MAG: UvrD-helicase domain-containing protein, partial [Proteobacteria bacterium]|nr:UvrD-helicase domain-containing protein [Pseudomonadota bacterium]